MQIKTFVTINKNVQKFFIPRLFCYAKHCSAMYTKTGDVDPRAGLKEKHEDFDTDGR